MYDKNILPKLCKSKFSLIYSPCIQINGWKYSPGRRNSLRIIKISNNRDSNYRTKNLLELTEFSNQKAFELSEFDTNLSQICEIYKNKSRKKLPI